MDQSLYHRSLQIALPLMLFFGFHMLLGRAPEKRIFSTFLLSRRLMGTALLLLSANYAVHLFLSIRLTHVNATILMNLSTYFLCYWLFSSAMTVLLDKRYVTPVRMGCHVALWMAFSAVSGMVLLLPAGGQPWGMGVLAGVLVVYGLLLSVRLLRTYARATRRFCETHSDDIGSYVRWLRVFTFWAIGFGVSSGLLTFLPDAYVYVCILSSIPFYVCLYCSYQNYILFFERVERAIREDGDLVEAQTGPEGVAGSGYGHAEITDMVKTWVDSEGYRRPGITLGELARLLGTNRTYLSDHIRKVYGMSFRDWISDLRIEYAKRLMKQQPQLRMTEVCEMAGFLSVSHFTRTFREKEGCPPSRWLAGGSKCSAPSGPGMDGANPEGAE